uniref:RNA helicase n=1 Tax=Theileria annulata TaxID=5874 RepID=A0A3B0MK55_THEAN
MLKLLNFLDHKLINNNLNFNILRVNFNNLRINNFSTNVFNEKTVDFKNLPFNEKFVNNLKSLGINNLKLFQYYTFKLLTDKLTVLPTNTPINKEERLKIVLYNDLNTGKTIGTLLPFLYSFTTTHSNSNKTGLNNNLVKKLLIVCNNNEVKKLINFIISVNPSLNIVQLTGYNTNGVKGDIILASDKVFMKVYENIYRLNDIEFVLFTNFTETINYINIDKVVKALSDSNVICLINSLDNFKTFSNKFYNFSLYNFVQGTRERLIGDKRTDLLKLEIDLNKSIPITTNTTDNGNKVVKSGVVETCLCKVLKNSNKIGVIRNLIYCNYDLPTFLPVNMLQKFTSVKFSNNCVIFTNRKNLNKMAEIEPFKSLSVQLQTCINSYEKAEKINLLNSLSKPILLTSQLLHLNNQLLNNSSWAKNVNLVIFHTFPREEFYKHLLENLSNNTKIIILYNKKEYGKLVEMVKSSTKNVKVQIIPSNQYISNHNFKILNKLITNVINEKKEELVPYLKKSEELFKKYNNSIINYSVDLLLNDNVSNFKN